MKINCVICGKEIIKPFTRQKTCSRKCGKAYRRAYQKSDKFKESQRKYYDRKMKSYVKVITPSGKTEKIYADGVAQELQKQVPQITEQVMKKLLRENEN